MLPELLFEGFRCFLAELNGVESKRFENSLGSFKAFVAFKVSQLTTLGKDKDVELRGLGHTDEAVKLCVIISRNFAGVYGFGKQVFENVFPVVLPYSHEMRLIGNKCWHLVGEDQVFFPHDLRSHFAQSFVFCFERFASFFGGRVISKQHWLVLVSISE
jgi:hypothetical protein